MTESAQQTETVTEKKQRSIASLFSDKELKLIFQKFLMLIGILEALIFIVCWIYQLGLGRGDGTTAVDIPFPWRTYFMISFMVPVFITFLLGLFVMAFNKYMNSPEELQAPGDSEEGTVRDKFQAYVHSVRQIPFLLALLVLAGVVGVIYRIDDIFSFMAQVGEKSARYFLIVLISLLVVATIGGLAWLVFTYKIRKKTMEFQYKRDVMERMGLLILHDDTVIDNRGKILLQPETGKKDVILLPASTESAPRERRTDVPN